MMFRKGKVYFKYAFLFLKNKTKQLDIIQKGKVYFKYAFLFFKNKQLKFTKL